MDDLDERAAEALAETAPRAAQASQHLAGSLRGSVYDESSLGHTGVDDPKDQEMDPKHGETANSTKLTAAQHSSVWRDATAKLGPRSFGRTDHSSTSDWRQHSAKQRKTVAEAREQAASDDSEDVERERRREHKLKMRQDTMQTASLNQKSSEKIADDHECEEPKLKMEDEALEKVKVAWRQLNDEFLKRASTEQERERKEQNTRAQLKRAFRQHRDKRNADRARAQEAERQRKTQRQNAAFNSNAAGHGASGWHGSPSFQSSPYTSYSAWNTGPQTFPPAWNTFGAGPQAFRPNSYFSNANPFHSGPQSFFSGAHNSFHPAPSASVRRPTETKAAIISAWKSYQARWEALPNLPSEPAWTFATIPWPVTHSPSSPADLTPDRMRLFFLANCHSTDKDRKARVRAGLLRWHIDKFTGKYLKNVRESDKPAVQEGVSAVTRLLQELQSGA